MLNIYLTQSTRERTRDRKLIKRVIVNCVCLSLRTNSMLLTLSIKVDQSLPCKHCHISRSRGKPLHCPLVVPKSTLSSNITCWALNKPIFSACLPYGHVDLLAYMMINFWVNLMMMSL